MHVIYVNQFKVAVTNGAVAIDINKKKNNKYDCLV